jgi:hypothetical protein
MRSVVAVFLIVVGLLLATGPVSASTPARNYMPKKVDPAQGIVVGSVFERAVFQPYGAEFYIETPQGETIVVSTSGRGGNDFVNVPPKTPKGVGRLFALQLPPGTYTVTGWALDYGAKMKASVPRDVPIQFTVEAGKAIYLGRFDASRFMEMAYIHDDSRDEDMAQISKKPVLATLALEDRALDVQGWWLPEPAGKAVLERLQQAGAGGKAPGGG